MQLSSACFLLCLSTTKILAQTIASISLGPQVPYQPVPTGAAAPSANSLVEMIREAMDIWTHDIQVRSLPSSSSDKR